MVSHRENSVPPQGKQWFLSEKQTENAIRNNIKDPEDETITCTQRPKERTETLEKDA